MEKRKLGLRNSKRCRFCLNTENIHNIHRTSSKIGVKLSHQILKLLCIEIFPSDGMPAYICECCNYIMGVAFEFKQMCRLTDYHISEYLKNGDPLQPMDYPESILKVFQTMHQSKGKTIVTESGACVEVSQDNSASEDEDGNVYNIQFGTEVGKKAKGVTNIQVVTDGENISIDKTEADESTSTKTPGKVVKQPQIYKCNYCDKKYAKVAHFRNHLYSIHDITDSSQEENTITAESNRYECEDCESAFATEDELIYHSAIHATQNLTCPLCQEKFENVDAVTVHIKSHVEGLQFMCDLCELVFTNKEKLVKHAIEKHPEEQDMPNIEESMEEDKPEPKEDEKTEDEEESLSVEKVGDEVLVQLKKPSEFIRSTNTTPQLSWQPSPYTKVTHIKALSTPEKVKQGKFTSKKEMDNQKPEIEYEKPDKEIKNIEKREVSKLSTSTKATSKPKEDTTVDQKIEAQISSVIRRIEEPKRKIKDHHEKGKTATPPPASSNDKSLKLLEKELQELKRTSSRGNGSTELPKSPKLDTSRRTARQTIITSTPKPKPEEKKPFRFVTEKRRTLTKENSEPKDVKNLNNNQTKDEANGNESKDKEALKDKEAAKDKEASKDKEAPKEKEAPKDKEALKEKEDQKEKETPKDKGQKQTAKAIGNDSSVRRSRRSNKVRDYAKMVQDDTTDDEDFDEIPDDMTDEPDNDDSDSSPEIPVRPKKMAATITPSPTPRKRGRPRKDGSQAPPAKIPKPETPTVPKKVKSEEKSETKLSEETSPLKANTKTSKETIPLKLLSKSSEVTTPIKPTNKINKLEATLQKTPQTEDAPTPDMLSPAPVEGMTSENTMQVGNKTLKVKKILMTKAEVARMVKEGLVQIMNGHVIVKPGIKLPEQTNTMNTSTGDASK